MLCEEFTKLELSLRGLSTKVKTLKHSDFRTTLIEYCRTSFNQFFDVDKFKNITEEDKLKFRHRLFCNVKFVGELNRRNLLSEPVIMSVFDMLLGVESLETKKKIDNDTVEGGVVLLNKIGYLIDDRLAQIEARPLEREKGKAKDEKIKGMIQRTFARLEEIVEKDEVNQRVKLLIKNLLDNRESNWEKSRGQDEKGPKKVDELRQEEMKKHEEESRKREAESDEYEYGGQGGYYDQGYGGRGGQGGRPRNQTVKYQVKGQPVYEKNSS